MLAYKNPDVTMSHPCVDQTLQNKQLASEDQIK